MIENHPVLRCGGPFAFPGRRLFTAVWSSRRLPPPTTAPYNPGPNSCFMRRFYSALLILTFAGRAGAGAASTTAPTTQDLAQPPITLGVAFESRGAGLDFCPPAGGTMMRETASGDIVRFLYPARDWDLHVKATISSRPIPLSAAAAEGSGGGGLLELTANQIKDSDPTAEILQRLATEVGSYKVGLITARTTIGVDRAFTEDAIFQSSEQRDYIFQLTAGVGAANEAAAKAAFDLMLPSVHLQDLSKLAREQQLRLTQSHRFYDLLDEKRIVGVLEPSQWMRVIRDGKDAGFIEETELAANHFDHDGVEITVKSHIEAQPGEVDGQSPPTTAPAGPVKTDRVAKFFVTFDRRHEDWYIGTTVDDGSGAARTTSELGNSDQEIHEHIDTDAIRRHQMGDAQDPKQPPVYPDAHYTLSVNDYTRNKASPPIERELSPFYLPFALAELLPRLLPPDQPEMYMFASYVSDQHEVMARYVDVSGVEDVTLDGQAVRAVLVKDRIGVDGSPTVHYLTPDGKWLGTVNEEQKLLILPSDARTISQLWHIPIEPPAPSGR